ncbi:MAG TPA: plastocyanin/azurin family copper-binding protein [Chloroflexia bacterium]|nr:plastocyanin/azurin family copper-binding protein [Chloroflexia bacterium]
MIFGAKVRLLPRSFVLGLVLGGLALGATACGGETAPPTPIPQQTAASQSNIDANTPVNPVKPKASNQATIQLSEWTILPKGMGVAAGKLTLNVVNKGEFSHNLVIKNGNQEIGRTPNFESAESPKTIDLDLQPGTYTMLCDIPGHAEKGMTGTLSVTK